MLKFPTANQLNDLKVAQILWTDDGEDIMCQSVGSGNVMGHGHVLVLGDSMGHGYELAGKLFAQHPLPLAHSNVFRHSQSVKLSKCILI